jgi:tRNA modification GTPase
VGNKVDLLTENKAQEKFSGDGVLFISAKNNAHIDLLRQRMTDKVIQGTVSAESTIVTNARHYQALQEVNQSIDDITSGLNNHIPGDLLALDIRRCLHYLGEITGEITNEDRLDYIFSKFCIGK